MKAKCYYCNKELTEKTIKRHMKSCAEMKDRIERAEKEGKSRAQFIIAIKSKYVENDYCIYLSIDSTLGLIHLDQFIRDLWVECCGHLSSFNIRKEFYQDYQMNTKLKDILNLDEKFEYEYDFGSTTFLTLEVVDIIEVPKGFTQIEIVARNNEIEGECIEVDENRVVKFDYCNSPREGVCAYEGNKIDENKYLPGNDIKYKMSKKQTKKQEDEDSIFNYVDDFYDDLLDIETITENTLNKDMNKLFTKGIYSFDIVQLIGNLKKDYICDIAKWLKISNISKLNKKQLIDKVLSEYEESIEKVIYLFDEERYKMLRTYFDNDGVKRVNEIEEYEIDKVAYFIGKGILFSSMKDGEHVILMPEIIKNLLKDKNNIEYRNIIKKNSEIINLYRGMNRAYGILTIDNIGEIFKRYNIVESDKYRISEVLTEGEYYYEEYEKDGLLFINSDIEMWWLLLEEIERAENLDYAEISKEELLKMADEHWVSETENGKNFSGDFEMVFEIDKDSLKDLMMSLAVEIQNKDVEELNNILLTGSSVPNEEAKKYVCDKVSNFTRNIRMWKYKGATINEKLGNIIKEEKKKPLGRNDPCPCESGKKYKNCCGKNDNVIQLFKHFN